MQGQWIYSRVIVWRCVLPLLAASAALIAGCDKRASDSSQEDRSEGSASQKHRGEQPKPAEKLSFTELKVPPRPQATPELIAQGKRVYEQNCAVCHGSKGDGKGPAAAFLVPQPRDFVAANYRLRTTPMTALPTDEDLFRSISLGMPGTPMPPWRHVLNDQDRWALVEYVKTFSEKFRDESNDRATLVELGNPPPKNDQAIKDGKELFTALTCVQCHGEAGRGDGPNAMTLVNDAEQKISPRDFSKASQFKSGYSTRDIVRTMLTGFNGTPMIGFADAITNKAHAWKIAYFIETLARPERQLVDQPSRDYNVREALGDPDVRIKLIERAWQFEPIEIRVKKGQVVEVTFEPTDNGLGVGHGFAISGYDEVAFMNGAMVGVPKRVKFRADRAGEFTYYCATQCSTEKLHPMMNGTLIVEETSTQTAAFAKQGGL
jgi:mono/diheme cytochrome c family protein